MREVIYADELLTELMRVHPFIDVDAINLCIDRTRKLSTHSLIEELVSRYENQIDDKDKEIEKLKARVNEITIHSNKLNDERAKEECNVMILKRKLKDFVDDVCENF